MTRPTSRVLQLLELLQSSGLRTVSELAERLGVDERTVRRYVGHLLELDIPVEAVRGRYGGYRIAPGYRMPPLMLSDDEAVAVLLRLVAVRSSPSPAVSDTAAATAIAKIRRALPDGVAERARALLDSAVLASPGAPVAAPDAEVLLTIADGVRHGRPLAIRYRSADGSRSERRIHPYELISYESRWYLVALDLRPQEERTFRLDRIAAARTLPGAFASPPRGDAVEQLVAGFARADYRHRVTLRVQASKEHIEARLPASVAVLDPIAAPQGTPVATPWHRVEIRAAQLDWIPAVIASLDCAVVIDRPDELRDRVAETAARLTAASRPA